VRPYVLEGYGELLTFFSLVKVRTFRLRKVPVSRYNVNKFQHIRNSLPAYLEAACVFLHVKLHTLKRYWIMHTCDFTVLRIHVLIHETPVTESPT
jgi:hypothetical protein